MATIIFTDGSSRGNPGPGGWGAIVNCNNKVIELGGRSDKTTNNRMELTAVIEALRFVAKERITSDVVLYTDSEYVKKGATLWVYGWQRNDWKTSTKGEVLNKDLWQDMVALLTLIKVEWRVIYGHSGIPGNERCDVIATSMADKTPITLYNGDAGAYPVNLDQAGVVFGTARSATKPKSSKAYSYVSSIKGVVKDHKTWTECEARVKGEPHARYKKALSKEDEIALVQEFSPR